MYRPHVFSRAISHIGRRCASSTATKSNPISAGQYALLAVPAVTFGLGTWQIFRKQQKEDLITQLEEKLKREASPLPIEASKVANMEYERVSVTGEFLHDQEMQVAPRTITREVFTNMGDLPDTGAQVVTPFKRADTGDIILVNRGFVPDSHRDPSTRQQGQTPGVITVEGIVRKGERKTAFVPTNQPETNTWHWLDIFGMAKARQAQPILIDVVPDGTPACGLPLGGQTQITIRNEHLQYIITWYSLSIITLVMWLSLRHRKPAKVLRRPPPVVTKTA
eukprot:TRINITY_DN9967_c0_g2_i7.p1 TRINITY_DN9967_c0_g2~~TRINITY_DN9967_c0_g2_i7.p1  ORF type:complete len:307 (+),score=45.30 TRINITY_DN9967_c0_g2_i7:86-922(+)